MSVMRLRRLVAAVLLAALTLVGTAPAALADAAGPTDYRTDIVSIEPATAAIAVSMIGGDAFLRLEIVEPVEVVVLGYQAEPYLRFATDGTVYENRRSPAVWLNQERYGDEEPPAFANAEARPEWFEVSTTGSYSWHDHRSHWMNPSPPPSAQAGDQVLEATVPIDVNGERITITVASYLLDSPSAFPAVLGVVGALAIAAALWGSLGRPWRVSRALVALLVAGAAVLLGAVAFRSVPAETEPSALLWLLPAVAAVSALIVVVVRRRVATTVYLDGLVVAAGAALVGWGLFRFDAVRRALIPSDAPAPLDRLVIMLALVTGIFLAASGLYGLINPKRLHRGQVAP